MSSIKIFREGKADERFLRDVVEWFFPGKSTNVSYVNMDGYTNFKGTELDFKRNTLNKGTNLLILDADIPDEGGFMNRSKYVESQKEKYNIEFELFLFPNNKDDGNLETLLSHIINPSNKGLLECWDNYVECISAQKKSDGREINKPDLKKKIYTYIDLLDGSSHAREEYRDYLNKDHWDLTSPALTPLVDFLRPHF